MAYKRISPQPVVEGGTGATTLTGVVTGNGTSAMTANSVTQYGVLVGGASNAVGSTDVGSSGQVLTSNGAGMDPTFQAASGGDVSGPGSSTDNALARWSGTGGDTLQNSTVIVTDDGEMTNSSQPSFLAYLSSSINNVTGDGTQYTIIFDTEVFDQGTDYVLATGVFTAPVTGKYQFNGSCARNGNTALATGTFVLAVTSNLTYRLFSVSSSGVFTDATLGNTIIVDMDASDTFTLDITVNGTGSTDVGLNGAVSSVPRTWVCGTLMC